MFIFRNVCRVLGFGLISLLFMTSSILAGEVYDGLPSKIDPAARYVIYMHGGRLAKNETVYHHDVLGVYDLDVIRKALKDDEYHLISYTRPYKEEDSEAAQQLSHEVQALMGEGVPAENITLVGFSTGAIVVVIAASILEQDKLNIALLAGCAGRVIWEAGLAVWGRVVSFYDEEDDNVSSCKVLESRGGKISDFKETVFKTGKGHGLFFTPDEVWLGPLKGWIKR